MPLIKHLATFRFQYKSEITLAPISCLRSWLHLELQVPT
jgi:hypothetical protein